MTKHMHADFSKLQEDLLIMAGYVEDAITNSITALLERNTVLADKVLEADNDIDDYENTINEECLRVLALHQPVAVDLRRITSIMMITTDLERIGDLTTGIAERAIKLAKYPAMILPERLWGMCERTNAMVKLALDAFVKLDVHAAKKVILLDDAVDQDNDLIIIGCKELMKKSPDNVDAGLSLFSAVRYLERIADHATNIAEDVVYLVEGEIIRHHHASLSGNAQ